MAIARSVRRAMGEWRIPTLLLLVVTAGASNAQTPRVVVDVRAGTLPGPFVGGDGLIHLSYELDITASGAGSARVDRVDVFGDSDPKPLVTYSTDDLEDRIMRPDAEPGARRG